MITINYYERVKEKPEIFTQLTCKDLLFVHYKCPSIESLIGKWSQNNYILYVTSGKLAYHTPGHSWLLTPGSAVFIKKGAGIMEKFFEQTLCIMTFFIPDSYLTSFMRENHSSVQPVSSKEPTLDLVIPLDVTEMMRAYFDSMIPYFNAENAPSEDLLELKFRELLLNIITNPANKELNGYLQTLQLPNVDHLQQIMDANCLFNLSLQDYAKLCNRSLSSFKRDFLAAYKTNPGHWLLTRRLDYANHLVLTSDKSINDIAFESGFENTTHFSRAFKKRFGLSPSQFRQQASTLPVS
jgi:AraC family transcriptional regulator, exoenzyme S synthesis regulatory protein ExsA